jgi:hypothetical protein
MPFVASVAPVHFVYAKTAGVHFILVNFLVDLHCIDWQIC